MLVRENLRLDMARSIKKALKKTFATTEGGFRLAHGGMIELCHILHLPGHLQSPPAAAMRCLDRNRQTVRLCKGDHLLGCFNRAIAAGDQRSADRKRDPPRLDLVAERFDHVRIRTDPCEACLLYGAGEFRPFGQEPIAGMHGIRTGPAGNLDELLDVEIGLCRTTAAQPISLIREPDEQRIQIRVGIDRDGLEPVVAAGADDAHGDFAAIGNQHFLHRGLLTVSLGLPSLLGGSCPVGLDLGEARYGPELDFRIHRDLAGEIEMIFGDRADNRVAAGQRMVGEEEHGLPAMRNLDGTRRRPLARKLRLVLALEASGPERRIPTRFDCGVTS